MLQCENCVKSDVCSIQSDMLQKQEIILKCCDETSNGLYADTRCNNAHIDDSPTLATSPPQQCSPR